MRILVLEHPRLPSERHFNDIANTPLWSCLMGGYAAATLRDAGHETEYLDAAGQRWDFARTADAVLERAPDMLAVNAVYFWERTTALADFFEGLRSRGYGGHVTLFGFFPTLAWETLLKAMPGVDSIVVGECEHTLAELAGELDAENGWQCVPGVATRWEGFSRLLAVREPEKDPDRFPFPVRDACDCETTGILGSRGCYNHCTFCPIPSFYNQGPLWRGRSPENILAEVEGLVAAGKREFYFMDPNFIGPGRKGRERTMELMRMLTPLKIEFGMETRPNDLTPELLKAMTDAGLTDLLLGVESASPSLLKTLHKSASQAEAERAVALCREYGLEPEIGFLLFVPESAVSDIRYNFEFLRKNGLLDRLDRTANLLSHRQIVLKGTSGFRAYENQGVLKPCGAFGMEGTVDFTHPAVAWLADVVVPACHFVLREMGKGESGIYYENGPSEAWRPVNDLLVGEVESLIEQVERSGLPDEPPEDAAAGVIERLQAGLAADAPDAGTKAAAGC